MAKDNFLLHNDWIPLFVNMKPEQAGLLIQAICKYQLDGEIPSDDSSIFAMFMMTKKTMDEDKEKYIRECEKRRENANKRWNMQEDANAYNNMQEQKNYADVSYSYSYSQSNTLSDSYTSSKEKEDRGVGEEEKPKRETQEQIFDRLVEDQNVGVEMEKALREWLKYKSERREGYKQTGMKSMITQVQNAVRQFGEIAVMDRIQQAMANGWKGMNLDKMEHNKASPQRRMDGVNEMLDRWKVASEELERRRNGSG